MRDLKVATPVLATVAGFCPARLHAHYDVSPVQLQPLVARLEEGRNLGCSQLSGKSGAYNMLICNHNVDIMRINLYRILVYLLTYSDFKSRHVHTMNSFGKERCTKKAPIMQCMLLPKMQWFFIIFATKRDRK